MDRATLVAGVEITPEMISEGASVLHSLRGVFDDYSLAAEVYKAMALAGSSEKKHPECVPSQEKSAKRG